MYVRYASSSQLTPRYRRHVCRHVYRHVYGHVYRFPTAADLHRRRSHTAPCPPPHTSTHVRTQGRGVYIRETADGALHRSRWPTRLRARAPLAHIQCVSVCACMCMYMCAGTCKRACVYVSVRTRSCHCHTTAPLAAGLYSCSTFCSPVCMRACGHAGRRFGRGWVSTSRPSGFWHHICRCCVPPCQAHICEYATLTSKHAHTQSMHLASA